MCHSHPHSLEEGINVATKSANRSHLFLARLCTTLDYGSVGVNGPCCVPNLLLAFVVLRGELADEGLNKRRQAKCKLDATARPRGKNHGSSGGFCVKRQLIDVLGVPEPGCPHKREHVGKRNCVYKENKKGTW